jgi:hypothetical protein
VYRVINDPNTAGDQGGSYKLAAPGHDLGTLTNDALDAVVGRVGALPPLIPIRVAAHDNDTRRTQLMHVNAADETDAGTTTGFSPISTVAPMAIAQAGSTVMRSAPGRLTGRMCLTINIREGRRSARFCNRYVSTSGDGSGSNAVAINAALDALDAFGLIDAYQGRPPHISRVGARLDLQRGERVADILGIRAPRTVRPGQRIRLRVALRRHRGPRIVRRYRVRLPRDIRPGRRTLTISSGQSGSDDEEDLFEQLLSDATNGGEQPPGPATLDELVAAIRALRRFDGVSGRIGGQEFTAFRDPNLLIAGQAETRVRVRRR